MNYADIRHHVQTHFRELLIKFKAKVAENGPLAEDGLYPLTASQGFAKHDLETWLDSCYADEGDELVATFCKARGIREELSASSRQLLLNELHRAHRVYYERVISYNGSFDDFEIEEALPPPSSPGVVHAQDEHTFEDIVQRHLSEGKRAGLWAEKTQREKREALALLGEITGSKAVSSLAKADARHVKEVLQKLPKNRNKSPATRDLSFEEMLKLPGLPLASVRTLNAYLSHYQTFLSWAVQQGYAETNVFDGLRFRVPKRDKQDRRDPFSADQLRVLFDHLTLNPDGLVPKDDHKWVTLIAVFTGARLNEVAQLTHDDVRLIDDVWCIAFTSEDESGKRLKTSASKRLVPIHDTLVDLGLLTFVMERRSQHSSRLFNSLSYDDQNGYGRNVGRWFNESLLVKLGFKTRKLVFHSLRHSMNTQLAQKDVPDHLQKAVLGHTQSGMSYDTYFKEGFLPSQLQPVVNKFTI